MRPRVRYPAAGRARADRGAGGVRRPCRSRSSASSTGLHLRASSSRARTGSPGTLRRLGVGPGRWSASAPSARCEMLVGLLGVLQPGGAYVPIDPALPADRQRFMLEDARCRVLADPGVASRRASGARSGDRLPRPRRPSGSPPPAATLPPARRRPDTSPTSSTPPGRPARRKASQIPHRAARQLPDAHARERPGLERRRRRSWP